VRVGHASLRGVCVDLLLTVVLERLVGVVTQLRRRPGAGAGRPKGKRIGRKRGGGGGNVVAYTGRCEPACAPEEPRYWRSWVGWRGATSERPRGGACWLPGPCVVRSLPRASRAQGRRKRAVSVAEGARGGVE